MTEGPGSNGDSETSKNDSVEPAPATRKPPGEQAAEMAPGWSLDRIGLGWLVLAAVSLAVIAALLYRATGSSGLTNIFVSLTLAAICLFIFKAGSYASDLVTTIGIMWLPIGVTLIAGILLFYEGQGRDLGVGLLGEGHFKLSMLFLILIYWAVNNWHSARLGLNYYFPTPTGDERWLFWTPRFLGVCAHFFAALSLALAGLNLRSGAGEGSSILNPLDFLVFTAPAAIALVTLSAWAIDVSFSRNRKKPIKPKVAKALVAVLLLVVIALFLGLWFASSQGWLPEGLFPATCWISASAFFFLLYVSFSRRTFTRTPISHDGLTAILAVIALIVGGVIWYSPILVGDLLGSLNIAFFAFGASLAILNGFGLVAKVFFERRLKADRVKFAALSVAFLLLLAALTSLLRDFHRVRLCATEACSKAPSQAWSPIPATEDRPTVREAALAWYDQAEKLYHKGDNNKQEPVPMLVIATAGGGIRASYWTATVLERLQEDLQKKGRPLDKLLFAISGVSGGSVGAMDYVAALHAKTKPTEFLQSDFLAPAIASLVFVDGPSNFLPDLGQIDRGTAIERSFENGSKGYLAHSFLSFFPEKSSLASNWRPALLLNATHQETGRRVIASNLKIERDTFLDSFDEFDLLGSDMRASTVAHNSARFTYVSPAGKLVPQSRQGFSLKLESRGYVIDGGYFENYGALTALELARSARLEIEKEKGRGSVKLIILQISSDPTLTRDRTRVRTREDGQNCFLTTAKAPTPPNSKPNFLSFVDSGFDPVTHRWQKNDGEGVVVSYLNELAAPLIGVTAVREAHGNLAAAELASAVCVERDAKKAAATQSGEKQQPAAISDPLVAKAASAPGQSSQLPPSASPTPMESSGTTHFAHLAMCEVSENKKAPIVPPLGWVLSKPMRDKFSAIFDDCGNQTELAGLENALN
jgi:hypothetical protein